MKTIILITTLFFVSCSTSTSSNKKYEQVFPNITNKSQIKWPPLEKTKAVSSEQVNALKPILKYCVKQTYQSIEKDCSRRTLDIVNDFLSEVKNSDKSVVTLYKKNECPWDRYDYYDCSIDKESYESIYSSCLSGSVESCEKAFLFDEKDFPDHLKLFKLRTYYSFFLACKTPSDYCQLMSKLLASSPESAKYANNKGLLKKNLLAEEELYKMLKANVNKEEKNRLIKEVKAEKIRLAQEAKDEKIRLAQEENEEKIRLASEVKQKKQQDKIEQGCAKGNGDNCWDLYVQNMSNDQVARKYMIQACNLGNAKACTVRQAAIDLDVSVSRLDQQNQETQNRIQNENADRAQRAAEASRYQPPVSVVLPPVTPPPTELHCTSRNSFGTVITDCN